MEPMAAPDSCCTGLLSNPTGSDLEEIRELRSSKLDGKDLPQELYIYKRPLHPSEIRGCVIMDTCAVVIDPTLIELSVKKCSSCHAVFEKMGFESVRIHGDFIGGNESQEKVRGFVAAPNDNDDLILKCAYRIQAALPDDCALVNKIFFVTNDFNLSLKATAHGVVNFTTQVYLGLLQNSGHLGTVEEEEPMEIDPTPEAMQPKHSSQFVSFLAWGLSEPFAERQKL
ncbi:hypothetical protein ANCDUO_08551 [Ancylostoma duodenale]|uniref:PIN domain-containing protein n=1 Tax=Ancylostoma duodenale TaxID=51022 RepID=A0A0C2GVN7_9BILA|nr:hypothetical protein ANCDUO_08551 [Ancylostoma duodenale]